MMDNDREQLMGRIRDYLATKSLELEKVAELVIRKAMDRSKVSRACHILTAIVEHDRGYAHECLLRHGLTKQKALEIEQKRPLSNRSSGVDTDWWLLNYAACLAHRLDHRYVATPMLLAAAVENLESAIDGVGVSYTRISSEIFNRAGLVPRGSFLGVVLYTVCQIRDAKLREDLAEDRKHWLEVVTSQSFDDLVLASLLPERDWARAKSIGDLVRLAKSQTTDRPYRVPVQPLEREDLQSLMRIRDKMRAIAQPAKEEHTPLTDKELAEASPLLRALVLGHDKVDTPAAKPETWRDRPPLL